MAASGKGSIASSIARYGIARGGGEGPGKSSRLPLSETDAVLAGERRALRSKTIAFAAALAVLAFVSLGVNGAAGANYAGPSATGSSYYWNYNPAEVAVALFANIHDAIGGATHLFAPFTDEWVAQNAPAYFAVVPRAGVVGITLVCAVLLAVSGMLYQAVFKNPIAGPGMLGVGGGVSLGIMLLVYFCGVKAITFVTYRYALCYGLGAAILLFVILAGRRLSGKGKPFDIVTMLLIGSILSQLIGFVVSYMTLFVMEPDAYDLYYTLSNMLVVDASPISWAFLGAAAALSLVPVVMLRFKLNALAFDEQEVRIMGLDPLRLRACALVCGAIMILAAQIHCGAVGMVSLVVPFLSRSWFGCEFRKQLVGNVCIGTILLLACRDVADLIPFVGDGIALGSVVAIVAMPLFLMIMARHMRGWE